MGMPTGLTFLSLHICSWEGRSINLDFMSDLTIDKGDQWLQTNRSFDFYRKSVWWTVKVLETIRANSQFSGFRCRTVTGSCNPRLYLHPSTKMGKYWLYCPVPEASLKENVDGTKAIFNQPHKSPASYVKPHIKQIMYHILAFGVTE